MTLIVELDLEKVTKNHFAVYLS